MRPDLLSCDRLISTALHYLGDQTAARSRLVNILSPSTERISPVSSTISALRRRTHWQMSFGCKDSRIRQFA